MKFFQNRAVATVIAVVVVIASSLISSNVGMNRDLKKVTDSFFADGKSPDYYINQQIGAAASLATVGEHYSELASPAAAVREARSALASAEGAREITGMYNASVRLTDAVSDLKQAASAVDLSAADASTFTDGVNTVSGTMRQLLESDYNNSVRQLLRRNYQSFPGSLFASVLDIDEPVLFGP